MQVIAGDKHYYYKRYARSVRQAATTFQSTTSHHISPAPFALSINFIQHNLTIISTTPSFFNRHRHRPSYTSPVAHHRHRRHHHHCHHRALIVIIVSFILHPSFTASHPSPAVATVRRLLSAPDIVTSTFIDITTTTIAAAHNLTIHRIIALLFIRRPILRPLIFLLSVRGSLPHSH